MALIGARLTPQKGFVHGGILGMIADTVARAEVYARDGKHVATMQQTLMMLADTPDTAE
jgi:acyl-coenzyme A thioesterase PaaI-like protein